MPLQATQNQTRDRMVPLIDGWECVEWWWFHGGRPCVRPHHTGMPRRRRCTAVVQSSLACCVIGECAAKLERSPERSGPRGWRRTCEHRRCSASPRKRRRAASHCRRLGRRSTTEVAGARRPRIGARRWHGACGMGMVGADTLSTGSASAQPCMSTSPLGEGEPDEALAPRTEDRKVEARTSWMF